METIFKMILGFLGGILVELFKEIFVDGIFKLFSTITNFFKSLLGIENKENEENPLKTLEKKYLYKSIVLTENLNEKLHKGIQGAILEVIDEENAFVEFYEPNSKQQIEYKHEIVFKVELKKLKVIG